MAACYAICVGINEAPGTVVLDFSEADARRVHSRLAARGFDSTLLAGSSATLARWLSTVDEIVQQVQPLDQVVFYFSGHGRQVPNGGGPEEFQKVMDEVDDDEVFRMWDGELLDDVVAAQVARLANCRVLLIIDSCRAGGFKDAVLRAGCSPGAWVQLMAACEEDGISWGHSDQGSFFTAALLHLLDQPGSPETFDAWFQRATRADVLRAHPGQVPVHFKSTERAIEFELGSSIPSIDLQNVQAHVLYGFGHLPQHWLCFFRIEHPVAFAAALARDWFRLTSAAEYRAGQPREARALALSYAGLSKLRVRNLERLGVDPRCGQSISTFRADCVGRSVSLGDPTAGPGRPENWKVGGAYEEQRPDGVLILAGERSQVLLDVGPELVRGAGLQIVFAEEGTWSKEAREHFGFRDGLSKPGVAARPLSSESHPGVIPGTATSVHALETLLLTAPPEGLEWAQQGSFLVYRRLVQDVEAFERAMVEYAEARGRRGSADPQRAAERVMGRRRDGTSLALSLRDLAAAGDTEAFDYSSGGCPLGAHVRKCNPRLKPHILRRRFGLDGFPVLYRRGVSFGGGYDAAFAAPCDEAQALQAQRGQGVARAERGLHFMCYQASIERQYEFLVEHVVNNPHFPELGSGVDALIGARPDGDPTARRQVNIDGILRPLSEFVIPTGGGYFFAPSLSGLQALGSSWGELPASASVS